MDIKKFDLFAIMGSVIPFSLFFLLISDLTTTKIVNLQTQVLSILFIETQGLNIFQTITTLLSPFLLPLLGLIFLALGFVCLTFYGKNNQGYAGIITGAITAILSLVFFSFTLMSIFMALSFLVTCIYIVPLANTYFKELKKWKSFRLGARSLATVLIIFNVILSLGVFTEVYLNNQYKQGFEEKLTNTMTQLTASSLPTGQISEEVVKETIKDKIKSSPIVKSSLRLLPLTSALMVWIILEFLRTFVLSNLAGVFSHILIKFNRT